MGCTQIPHPLAWCLLAYPSPSAPFLPLEWLVAQGEHAAGQGKRSGMFPASLSYLGSCFSITDPSTLSPQEFLLLD